MIYKQCNRCKTKIPYPKTYCENCQSIIDEQKAIKTKEWKRNSNRNYNAKRDPKHKKFYESDEWKLLRDRVLQYFKYKCNRCGKIATEVHHKQTLKEAWHLRFQWNNLEALCHDCHDEEHERFKKKKNKSINKVLKSS